MIAASASALRLTTLLRAMKKMSHLVISFFVCFYKIFFVHLFIFIGDIGKWIEEGNEGERDTDLNLGRFIKASALYMGSVLYRMS